ncbi:helix-turn-helix domain-containing protein [Enterococcus olivae]
MKNFGEQVYQLRKDFGLSQEEVAEALGVSRQTISNWEHGLAQPTLDKAVELAHLFEVSLDELVGKKKQATKESNKLLHSLLHQPVTIYLYPNPDSNTWISINKTILKHCEITEVNPNSIRVLTLEKKLKIERLIFLKDIAGFERECN